MSPHFKSSKSLLEDPLQTILMSPHIWNGRSPVPDITLVHILPVIASGYYRLWSIIIVGISFVITIPEQFSRWVMELARWNCQCQQSNNNSRSVEQASSVLRIPSLSISNLSLRSSAWGYQHPPGANNSRSMEQASGIIRNRINYDLLQWRYMG